MNELALTGREPALKRVFGRKKKAKKGLNNYEQRCILSSPPESHDTQGF